MRFATFFIVGLALGAGGVLLFSNTQSLNTLSPITKYFGNVPPISTTTPLKGG